MIQLNCRTASRAGTWLIPAALGLSLVLAAASGRRAQAGIAGCVISNNTVRLGVNATGNLITSDGTGIQFVPNGADGVSAGCFCEGWGAADGVSGLVGLANDEEAILNLTVESFNCTATTAVSTVLISPGGGGCGAVASAMRVTHDYHPSPSSPFLYECTVTIQNAGGATIRPLYRRAIDWDIPPTEFDELVTIQRGNSRSLLYSSDDGFASCDPLSGASFINAETENTSFADNGPDDHGALFDFGFDPIAPGARVTFRIYYGVSPTELDALTALGSIAAEVFSLGQPSSPNGASLGVPNTFIFAFNGVGGDPVLGIDIEDIQVNCIKASSAQITWRTTRPGSTYVEFGSTPGLGQVAGRDEAVMDHLVLLTGLVQKRTYYFRCRSTDAGGDTRRRNGGAFTMARAILPILRTPRTVVTGTWVRRVGDQLVTRMSCSNSYPESLNNVRVLRLFLITGRRIVDLRATGLPRNLGNIVPGGCVDIDAAFPAALVPNGLTANIMVNGSYTGGTFGELVTLVVQ